MSVSLSYKLCSYAQFCKHYSSRASSLLSQRSRRLLYSKLQFPSEVLARVFNLLAHCFVKRERGRERERERERDREHARFVVGREVRKSAVVRCSYVSVSLSERRGELQTPVSRWVELRNACTVTYGSYLCSARGRG